MRVIIAAAGTAGHINPGLAIANKIKKEEKNSEIMFIGTTRGLENDLVPRAGYKLKTIDAYGLSKKLTIDNIKKMMKTLKGYNEAKNIIKEFSPDIVIGTGGYICGATILAASNLKIPTMLHESNSFPGKAIKMLANKTDTILVSFEDAIPRIKNAKNIVFTGTPVKIKKKRYNEEQKDKILRDLDLNSKEPIVLVFGGSQGAKKINDAMLEIIKQNGNNHYQVVWATGPKQYDIIKEELEKSNLSINNIKNMKIIPYIYNMEELMNVVDVIVARSGAMTITELALVGKPAIFIPLPSMSANRQLDNAKVLENLGAAKIILNEEVNSENLSKTIDEMLENPEKLKEMGNQARKIAKYNVEEKIYEETDSLKIARAFRKAGRRLRSE